MLKVLNQIGNKRACTSGGVLDLYATANQQFAKMLVYERLCAFYHKAHNFVGRIHDT